MSTKTVSDLLDSIEALSRMNPKPFGTSARQVLLSCAEHCEKTYNYIHGTVVQRTYSPSGAYSMEMLEWRDKIMKVVDHDPVMKRAYRRALREIQKAGV